jgi:SAM-dependent methyltransferase
MGEASKEEKMNSEEVIRHRLTRYLHGTGIEIGALHKPLKTDGPRRARVTYVDRLPPDELRRQYPELNGTAIVTPSIVDDGTVLEKIEDGSLDFIIANHLIEHLDNPLFALENWCRKLKCGGRVYLAVPDKRRTFDIDRPSTPVSHLVEDYRATSQERIDRNHRHYVETAEIIEKRVGEDARQRVESLIARQYSIHFHVWTFVSFREVLLYLIDEMQVPFTTLDSSPPQRGGDEFIFILEKATGQRLSRPSGILGRLQRRLC